MLTKSFFTIFLFYLLFGEFNNPLPSIQFNLDPEICDNAIDDDNDGLIDLNDEDCACDEIESVESLIPNPSFEDIDCCPDLPAQLSCAEGWIQASAATTDFIHLCGWLGWDGSDAFGEEYPPPMPFPDGSGIVGFRDGVVGTPLGADETGIYEPNWKEYAGACLNRPMEKDSLFRIEFSIGFVNPEVSPSIYVTIFGTEDCINLPFGPSNLEDLVGCPTNTPEWVELGKVYVFGGYGNQWVKTSIEFTPDMDINAVAIGPDCNDNLNDRSLYYFLDNLILDEAKSFEFEFEESGNPCSESFSISVNEYAEISYQWYLDGIALIGETSAQLSQNYGEGNYQVRMDDGENCSLLSYGEIELPVESSTLEISICHDEDYLFGALMLSEEGTYYDTLTSADGCDSIVTLELTQEDEFLDTTEVFTLEGLSIEIEGQTFNEAGSYQISTMSDNGCEQFTFVTVKYPDLYIPNIFSPNSVGLNNTFTIFPSDDFNGSFIINIYDKWGNKIFEGLQWNGLSKGEKVLPGVYIYLAELTLDNGKSKYISGTLTLVD